MRQGDGNPLTLDGFVYPKGLGVHPGGTVGQNAEVVYNLNGQCSGKFIAEVGVDDEVTSPAASVVFQVYLNGSGTPAYDSGTMTATTPRKVIDLPAAGVNELKLVVTNAGDGNSNDHADWANARVTGCSSNALAVRKRIGYYPVWPQTGDDLVVTYPQAPQDVPWTKVTHLNLAFVGINSAGQCAWVDWDESAATVWQNNAQALINYRNANYPGVKVLLTIGGWSQSYRFSAAMSAGNRTAFVNSCVSLMNSMGVDGIDIDWEYPQFLGAKNCPAGMTCQSSSDPANFTATLDAFRAHASFGSGKLLTAALHANRSTDPTCPSSPTDMCRIPYEYHNFFAGTPRRLDWASLITYDYHGPWENTVGFTAPYDASIAAMDFIVKGPNGADDTTDGVGSGNKGRVILGLPYFGPAWYNVAAPDSDGVGGAGTPVFPAARRVAIEGLVRQGQGELRQPLPIAVPGPDPDHRQHAEPIRLLQRQCRLLRRQGLGRSRTPARPRAAPGRPGTTCGSATKTNTSSASRPTGWRSTTGAA